MVTSAKEFTMDEWERKLRTLISFVCIAAQPHYKSDDSLKHAVNDLVAWIKEQRS